MPKAKLVPKAKKKKRWFTVLAPSIFRSAEIGHVLAFEPNNLIGRVIKADCGQLTGSPRDQSKKVSLKIKEVSGDRALTEATSFFLLDNWVARMTRGYKEKFICVTKSPSRDKRIIKTKLLFLLKSGIHRGVKSEIIKRSEQFVRDQCAKTTTQELFALEFTEKLAATLKRELRTVYPIDRINVWKLSIVA